MILRIKVLGIVQVAFQGFTNNAVRCKFWKCMRRNYFLYLFDFYDFIFFQTAYFVHQKYRFESQLYILVRAMAGYLGPDHRTTTRTCVSWWPHALSAFKMTITSDNFKHFFDSFLWEFLSCLLFFEFLSSFAFQLVASTWAALL